MKLILIISILLNVILIYNLGECKKIIERKERFISKFIGKEKELAIEFRQEVGAWIPKDLGKNIEFDNDVNKEG